MSESNVFLEGYRGKLFHNLIDIRDGGCFCERQTPHLAGLMHCVPSEQLVYRQQRQKCPTWSLKALITHRSRLSGRQLPTKTWHQRGWDFPICSCPGSGFEPRHTPPSSPHSSVAHSGWEAWLRWLSSVILLRHARLSASNQVWRAIRT